MILPLYFSRLRLCVSMTQASTPCGSVIAKARTVFFTPMRTPTAGVRARGYPVVPLGQWQARTSAPQSALGEDVDGVRDGKPPGAWGGRQMLGTCPSPTCPCCFAYVTRRTLNALSDCEAQRADLFSKSCSAGTDSRLVRTQKSCDGRH